MSSHCNILISAYDVREEHRKGCKTRLDIICYINRRTILHRRAVLSAHPTTSVSSYGMCGYPDYAFQSSLCPCIPMYHPTELSSTILFRPLCGTPNRALFRNIQRTLVRKGCSYHGSKGSPKAFSQTPAAGYIYRRNGRRLISIV
jgi:hypothetical protein